MFKKLFKKREDSLPEKKAAVRDLLRENLDLIRVDLFNFTDPLITMDKDERMLYLKYFFDLYKDVKLFERIKFHINTQARKTLQTSASELNDMAGAMNINGLAFVMNDIEKLANMYIKESAATIETPIDEYAIVPQIDEN